MKHLKMNKIRRNVSILSAVALASTGLMLSMAPTGQAATFVSLGTADGFAALAGSGMTRTGASTISGDIGYFPTITLGGAGTITLTGTDQAGNATTQGAKTDLTTAFNSVSGQALTTSTAAIAGGTLTPGVYKSGSSLALSGNIILDAAGNANAVFIFSAASTIVTASSTNISIINSGQACNVFYAAGSSATLGTSTRLVGNVLAAQSITDDGGAVVNGRLLARNGALTLNNTTITKATCVTPTPTPTPTATATPTPTPTPTVASCIISISNLVFTSDGAGTTTGRLTWTSNGATRFRYGGLPALYPPDFNYGVATTTWKGQLVNLVPGTSYPVSVTVRDNTNCSAVAFATAFNAVAPTPTATPTPTPTPTPTVVIPCVISNLVWNSAGDGTTAGYLTWTQTGQDTVLFTGLSSLYPAEFRYGVASSAWEGNLLNLRPGTRYPVSVTIRSTNGCEATATTTAFNVAVARPTPTPTATATPRPTPTKKPQVVKVPTGGVKTGDGSLILKSISK